MGLLKYFEKYHQHQVAGYFKRAAKAVFRLPMYTGVVPHIHFGNAPALHYGQYGHKTVQLAIQPQCSRGNIAAEYF